MKKQTLKKLCLIASLLCVGCVIGACNNEPKTEDGAATISSEWAKELEETVEFNSAYQLDYVVVDSEGALHAATATVKDSAGNVVQTDNGKFTVADKSGYTVEYAYTLNDKTYVRKVTLKVAALTAPVVNVQGFDSMIYLGETYVVPDCETADYYDGEIALSVTLSKQTENGEVELEDGLECGDGFTPTETGAYRVTYGATNSKGIATEKSVNFYVYKTALAGEDGATKALLSVDGSGYTKLANKDISSTYVSAGEAEIASFTGGYEGNATRIKAATNPNYRLTNAYTPAELYELSKTYTHVSMWFAVNGIVNDTVYLLDSAPGTFHYASQKSNKALTAASNGQWLQWTLTVKEYIALLEGYDYEYCKLIYPWIDPSKTGEDGVDNAYFYFGDLTFSYNDPAVCEVNAGMYARITNTDLTSAVSYASAEALGGLGISGSYTGNATCVTLTSGSLTNGSYKVYNTYTANDFAELGEKYNRVSMWLAATGIASSSLNINKNVDNFATRAGANGFGAAAKWQRLTLDFDDYVELVAATGYKHCPLLATANWSAVGVDGNIRIYIGDIEFFYQEPTIVEVDDTSYSKINNKDLGVLGYAAASELTAFTGGYTGNASVIKLQSNSSYRFVNPYTLAELEALKTSYNAVSLWLATDGIASGAAWLNKAGTSNEYFLVTANDGEAVTLTAVTNKVWTKYTLTLDEYIALVTKTDGGTATAAEYCLLTGAVTGEATATSDGMKLYVGDIFFENIAE